MCTDLCVDWLAQGHDLRSPATICGKHLMQTEVEICADVSICREVSVNYLRRRVGLDSIYILRYLQAQTNVQTYM